MNSVYRIGASILLATGLAASASATTRTSTNLKLEQQITPLEQIVVSFSSSDKLKFAQYDQWNKPWGSTPDRRPSTSRKPRRENRKIDRREGTRDSWNRGWDEPAPSAKPRTTVPVLNRNKNKAPSSGTYCSRIEKLKEYEPGDRINVIFAKTDLKKRTAHESLAREVALSKYHKGGKFFKSYARKLQSHYQGAVLEKLVKQVRKQMPNVLFRGTLPNKYVTQIAGILKEKKGNKYCFSIPIPKRYQVNEMKISATYKVLSKKMKFTQHWNGKEYTLFNAKVAIGGIHYDKRIGRKRKYFSPGEKRNEVRCITRVVQDRAWIDPDSPGGISDQGAFGALGNYAWELTRKHRKHGCGMLGYGLKANTPMKKYGGWPFNAQLHSNGKLVVANGSNYKANEVLSLGGDIMQHGTAKVATIGFQRSHGCFRTQPHKISEGAELLMFYASSFPTKRTWTGKVTPLNYAIEAKMLKQ